ncbi:hypothetical protein EJ110_NYTH23636 [Nymphaea thermarum]|nr:hypothetical protein EJ110_NYTH23636 [Nymphaea thermarum]
MAGFSSAKMKRKDLQSDLFDRFHDFSISSPARKIRRLDGVMPPILEEEPENSGAFSYQSPGVPLGMKYDQQQPAALVTEANSPFLLNQEKALVLYKPVNGTSYLPLLDLKVPISSDISFTVDSDIVTGLKDQLTPRPRAASLKEVGTSEMLALVPWVPSSHLPKHDKVAAQAAVDVPFEPMEAEDMDTGMEEDTAVGVTMPPSAGAGTEGLTWQQQHCMIPQPPRPTNPVMWSW